MMESASSAKAKQLAIIRGAHIAYEDHSGRFALFFDAQLSEGLSSLQIVALPDLPDIPGITWDVSKLNGRPCWVVDEGSMIKFHDWWRE